MKIAVFQYSCVTIKTGRLLLALNREFQWLPCGRKDLQQRKNQSGRYSLRNTFFTGAEYSIMYCNAEVWPPCRGWYIPYSSSVQPSDFGVQSVEAWCAADQYGHLAVYLCGQGLFWYLIFWFCLLPAIFGMLEILMLSSTTRLGAWLSFPLVQSLTAEGSFDVWSQLWTAIQVQLA